MLHALKIQSRNIGTGGYVYYVHASIVKVRGTDGQPATRLRLHHSRRYSQTAIPSITATGLRVVSGAGR